MGSKQTGTNDSCFCIQLQRVQITEKRLFDVIIRTTSISLTDAAVHSGKPAAQAESETEFGVDGSGRHIACVLHVIIHTLVALSVVSNGETIYVQYTIIN